MRFLCLHGSGSNNKVFEAQTAAIRYALDQHEFEFVEGTVPWPPAPEIQKYLPVQGEYYAYFDPSSPDSLRSALKDMRELLIFDGPYDAVMGFSQGAFLAATYVAQQSGQGLDDDVPSFKCAVFICGTVPWDVRDGRKLNIAEDGETIRTPVANIVGCKDHEHYGAGLELSKLCSSRTREVVDHGGGHELPRNAQATSKMAHAIKQVVERALLAQ